MKKLFWQKKNFSQAQTLIETVVATGVVTMALVGILSLALSTLSLGGQTAEWSQAINLARESVEVCQAVRSYHWFQEAQSWPYGLENGTWVANSGATDFDTAANGDIDSCRNCKVCFDDTAKTYSQADDNGDCALGFTLTGFRRFISIADGSDLGGDCSNNCEKSAIVTIKWEERGRAHQISLEKRFTDWR